MKYLVGALAFLLTMSVARSDEKPKYRFNDCVKVVHGFYRDCYGTVQEWTDNSHAANVKPVEDRYEISLMCRGAENMLKTFDESELTLARGKCNAN